MASRILVKDGANIWVQFPTAVRFVGRRDCTCLGFISSTGDIRMMQFDHGNNTKYTHTFRTRTNNSTPSPDDHMHPTLYIHTDGTVMAFCGGHDGEVYCYRSLVPEEIDDFGPKVQILASGGAYPRPIYIQGKLYCFYRKQISGVDRDTCFKTSTDFGTTWSSETTLIDGNGNRPYAIFRANGSDRIDFSVSTGHPEDPGVVNSIRHFYMTPSDDKKYSSGGVEIGAGGTPINTGNMTLVYDAVGAGNVEAWNWDIIGNGSSDVSIAFATMPTPASDHRYRVAKWDGASWSHAEVTAAGGPISGTYSPGIAFYDDGNTVVLSKDIGAGARVIQKWVLSGTWSQTETISDTSQGTRMRPVVPLNHHPTDLNVLWMEGGYVSYEDFETSIYCPLAVEPLVPRKLLCEMVQVVVPTAGSVRISVEFPPKLILAIGNAITASANHGRMIWGATDGTDSWCSGISVQNTEEEQYRYRTTDFVCMNNLTDTNVNMAVPTPIFDSYGADLTPSTFPAAATTIATYLVIGGEGITAKVGTFNTNTSVGTQQISDLGSSSLWKLFGFSRSRGDTTAGYTTGGIWTGGMAHDPYRDGSAVEQFGSDLRGSHLAATSDEQSVQRTNAVLVTSNTDLTISTEIAFVKAISGGFEINHVVAAGSSLTVGYWALAGEFRAKIGSFNAPTGTGDVSYNVNLGAASDMRFKPEAIVFGSASKAANNSPTAHCRQMYSIVTHPEQQRAFNTMATDALATWDSARHSNLDAAIVHASGATPGTVLARATLKRIDDPGFTLNWDTADATARQNVFLALGNSIPSRAYLKSYRPQPYAPGIPR